MRSNFATNHAHKITLAVLEGQRTSSTDSGVKLVAAKLPVAVIGSVIHTTVVPGSAAYASVLTVTATGGVEPVTPGQGAVYSDQVGVALTNHGSITGGGAAFYNGLNGAAGGIAVQFTAAATLHNSGVITGGQGEGSELRSGFGAAGIQATDFVLSNSGTIAGGAGGGTVIGYGGDGGDGGDLTDSRAVNTGLIRGGAGGGYYSPGAGAVGVALSGGTLTNIGTILGGAGGNGNDGGSGANGGAGVFINGGTLITSGTVAGGLAGPGTYYNGSDGNAVSFGNVAGVLVLKPGAVFDGRVVGNAAAGDVLRLAGQAAATLDGFGTEFTGFSSVAVEAGADWTLAGANDVTAGITLDGGTLVIDQGAVVAPSEPRAVGSFITAPTGIDIAVAQSSLLNGGSITGATGAYYGGAGGIGLVVSSRANVVNTGAIAGGAGGVSRLAAGAGGTGVRMTTGQMANTGVIAGGAGGQGPTAGAAGVGLVMTGGVFANSGIIGGGAGGLGQSGGDGGIGVTIDGATLINAGTISAGMAGPGYTMAGMAGQAAVVFGAREATLVIDPGAVFNGKVLADPKAGDILDLSGTGTGTLAGLGTQFTGFATFLEDQGSSWVLAGNNTLVVGTTAVLEGVATVTGTLKDAGVLGVGPAGTFQTSGNGTASIAALTLAGGTLDAAGALVIGNSVTGGQTSGVTVRSGFSTAGFGTIAGATGGSILDNGTIMAQGGTLALNQAVRGTGSLVVAAGASLVAHDAITVSTVAFSGDAADDAVFLLYGTITSTIVGFAAGDVIDLRNFSASSASLSNGKLTLHAQGNAETYTLSFAGSYTIGNFALTSDQAGGTELTFAPAAAALPSGDRSPRLHQETSSWGRLDMAGKTLGSTSPIEPRILAHAF